VADPVFPYPPWWGPSGGTLPPEHWDAFQRCDANDWGYDAATGECFARSDRRALCEWGPGELTAGFDLVTYACSGAPQRPLACGPGEQPTRDPHWTRDGRSSASPCEPTDWWKSLLPWSSLTGGGSGRVTSLPASSLPPGDPIPAAYQTRAEGAAAAGAAASPTSTPNLVIGVGLVLAVGLVAYLAVRKLPMLPQVASLAVDYAAANPRQAAGTVTRGAARLAGLSGPDAGALVEGGLPGWFWIVLGIGVGFVGGVYVASAHSEKVPSWMPGRIE